MVKRLSKPEHDLTLSSAQPLKQLSLTSKRTRYLVLPLLFRNAKVDPYKLPEFMSFTTTADIACHIETVTAQLQGPCNHIHPAWWSRLIRHLPNLDTLTILAAPHVFAEIGQVPIETSHGWAFRIPYQVVAVRCKPPARTHRTTPEGGLWGIQSPNNLNSNLLQCKDWTSLSINESSHLAAYSTYEYFLKTPPSLLISLRQQHHLEAQSTRTPFSKPTPTASFFNNLEHFSYTAIFPFYNHVDEVLKCVRLMKNLKSLSVKLCPEPESTVLEDELERNGANAGRTEGRIDVNDPWSEFDTSYTLIPHTIIYLTTEGSLERFETDDVKMAGIKDSLIHDIDRRLAELDCWTHIADGVWERHDSTGA